jgi:hypothetical protein
VGLADQAGADYSDANLSSGDCGGDGHQELPDFCSRRIFSSSRSRLYFLGSSITREGGAIGFRILAIRDPGRRVFLGGFAIFVITRRSLRSLG